MLNATGTITVSANNTVGAASSTPTLCINTVLTAITHATTGATGIGVAVGLPAGVTAAWAANTITISGTPTVAGVFNYTIPLAGGCGPVLNATGTITVSANNTVTLTSAPATTAQTVCINTPITNITYTTTGATGATVTNLPTGVTGTWAGNVVTISGTPTVAGAALTYTVTLTGGCGVITTTGTIAVTANNTVNLTSAVGTNAQTVCTNTAITNITYSTTGATGATVANLPVGVTGTWASNVVTISGTPTVSGGALTYTVTLTGGCGVITTTGTITVNLSLVPTFTSQPGPAACINTDVIYATQPGQTNYIWSIPGVAGTDYSITSGGTLNDNSLTLKWLTAGSKSVGINYTTPGGCTAAAASFSTSTLVSSALTVTTSHVNVVCFGGVTGSATAIPSGGTGPYSYSWNTLPVQTTITATGLLAGPYTVTVTDANLCTAIANVTITQPASALTGTITSQTNVLCFGNATGSITITGAGGTAPYQYNFDGGGYQVSGTFSSLIAGSHSVTVRDANFCTTNVPVTITQPIAALSGSISSQTNILCFGAATGSVTVAGSGGSTPYQYSIDGGLYQVSGIFNSLLAGIHTVTIRDANSCTMNVPVTLTQPVSALNGSIVSQTNVSCFGGSTGNVTVAGSGGTSPYVYSIDAGTFQALGTFNVLSAGIHTVTIRDNNLCLYNIIVNITQPATALAGTIASQTNVACFGASTGSVTLSGSGGTAPYQYNIDGGIFQGSGIFNGLVAGIHSAIVRDVNLCTFNVPVTITQPAAALTVTTSHVNVACFGGATGTATAIPAGGTGPYTYSWNTIPVQTTITATGLVAGTYTVTVTDANLCTATANAVITQPAAALTVTTSHVNVACFGGATGTATAIPAGGTGPYTYSWNTLPVQTTATATGLIAGTYTVTVTDANLCTATANVTITQPAAALTVTTSHVNVACFGGATGTATAIPAGGTGPYTYSWNTVPVQTTITATGLIAGTYTVTVTDANLCTATANAVITQPAAALTVTTSHVNVACFGGATGTATAIPAGGTGPYTYSWNTVPVQTTITATGLIAGTYTVTVTDANLCTATANAVITQPAAALTVTTSHVNVACFGGTTGTATAIPAGGTGPYTYSWNTVPVQTTITATGLIAGTYTVTVTDANLCTATANAVITQPAAALTVTTSQVNVACFGGATGTATAIPAGGTGPYTYSWNTVPVQTTITATGLIAGTYTVTVTDANLCTATANAVITQPAAALTVTTSHVNVACFGGATGTATAIPAGGTGPYTYSWNTVPVQTTITATGLIAGTYTVTVTDANLCTATANVTNNPACSSTDSHNDPGQCCMFWRSNRNSNSYPGRRNRTIYLFMEYDTGTDNNNSYRSNSRNIYCNSYRCQPVYSNS